MREKSNRASPDDLRPEYDFRSLRVVARGPGRKAPKQSSRKPRFDEDTMRPEYDFSKGVRGKYAKRYRAGTNLVLLDPDVCKTFRDGKAVNDALRLVIELRKIGSGRARAT